MIVTRDGWTKRQKSFTDVASIRVRDDDQVGWVYRGRARQTLTFFTDRGTAYTLRVNDIAMTTGHGDPIQKLFAFEDNEHIVGVALPRPAVPARARRARRRRRRPSCRGVLHGELAEANGQRRRQPDASPAPTRSP